MTSETSIELIDGPIASDRQYIRVSDGKKQPLASFGPRKLEDPTPGAVSSVIAVSDPKEATFWGIYSHDADGFAQHFVDVTDKDLAAEISEALAKVVDRRLT